MARQQQGDKADDQATVWVLGLALVIAALAGLWWLAHDPLVEAHAAWRRAQLWLLAGLGVDDLGVGTVAEVDRWLAETPAAEVSLAQMAEASSVVNAWFRWAAAPLLAWLGLRAWLRAVETRYRRVLSLDRLMLEQSREWRAIIPATVENPAEDTTGRWAPSLQPHEWAARAMGVADPAALPPPEELPEDVLRAAFAAQLRAPWRGAARLDPVPRALFAAMAMRGHARKEDVAAADEILSFLAVLWGRRGVRDGMDKALRASPRFLAYVDDVVASRAGQQAEHVAARHAYVETALVAVLDWARKQAGVLASSEWLWLKPEDRGLWYVTNDVGRSTAHPEAAGVFAHYRAEVQAGRAIHRPQVDEAWRGLCEWLRESAGE